MDSVKPLALRPLAACMVITVGKASSGWEKPKPVPGTVIMDQREEGSAGYHRDF